MIPASANMKALLISLLLLMMASASQAGLSGEVPWKYEGTSSGIKLYTRSVPGQEYKDFKGVMTVDVPIEQVGAAIADIDTYPEWFFLLKKATYLDKRPLDDCYIYLDINGIWPVKARDAVIHVNVARDPATHAIHINVEADPDYIARKDSHVRIPSMNSGWKLTPRGPNQTEIELVGNADPGGQIPIVIANMVVTVMPKESLKGLRKFLYGPKYKDLPAIYARNPRLLDLVNRLKQARGV